MTTMIGDSFRAQPEGSPSARYAVERTSGQIRNIRARRRSAEADQPAADVLTRLLDGSMPNRVWAAAGFLLGAIAREALGGPEAAGRALQHALDLTEPDQVLFPSLSHPPPEQSGCLDRLPSEDGTRMSQTADQLAAAYRPASPPRATAHHLQALTHGETRVLHYLPTNLSSREIAAVLHLSVHTIRTHQRHVYQKLGARSRTQAVDEARALGLLASSSHRRADHMADTASGYLHAACRQS